MSLRPPRQFSGRAGLDPIQAALEAELLREKAGTLSRMAQRLEKALAALDAGQRGGLALLDPPPQSGEKDPRASAGREREKLLDEAAEALWYLIIQRELMGLGGEERVCRDYRVPAAVRARLGVRRSGP